MDHLCERCGSEKAQKFYRFELESWESASELLKDEKDHYYLCLPCFDQLTEEPLLKEEVLQRMETNKENLQKVIQEGLVCPKCKGLIIEGEEHVCES